MIKVLVVDDALFMRAALKTMLMKNGFEVISEAESGALGVEKYKECRPDIVTMDITMPGMDGIEALKQIRSYDPKAKVVMVSAMGQEKIVLEAVNNGAKYFIVKPFKENEVIQTLQQVAST